MDLVGGRDYVKGEPHIAKKQLHNVIDIIADYLKPLKEFALKDVHQATRGVLTNQEIGWCLTVPAIWKDSEKAFMRKAAQRAGLISSEETDQKRLMFAYEPEAAALYCMAEEKMQLSAGQQFMTIDCGGGTVDITAHKVLPNLRLQEIGKGTGGLCGSTLLDEQFMRYLRMRFIGDNWATELQAQDMEAYFELIQEWELAKKDYKPNEKEEKYIRIFGAARKLFARHGILSQLSDEQDGDDDQIIISHEDMQKNFNPILSDIEKLVQQAFQSLNGASCDYIYLVGGFSMSAAVQNLIMTKFGDKVKKVIIPTLGGEAIVKGAVAFALDPTRAIRKSRLTYGIEVNSPFEKGVDNINKKFFHPYWKEDYCKDRISIFVTAGKSIGLDECFTNYYRPQAPDQKSVGFNIYSTEKLNPRYTDEIGLSKIGYLSISRMDISKGMDWSIKVRMYFGGTEIRVETEDEVGKKVETKLNFNYYY